jgi:hypothetical protein
MKLHVKLPRLVLRTTRATARVGTKAGVYSARVVGKAVAGRIVTLPAVEDVPEGRMLDLPASDGYAGGRTFVVDVPGPTPDAPTAVLLHGLGCTAYLCWFGCIAELSQTHRVVTFDQRWHGRGIHSDRFRFVDCADDAAAVLDALGIDQALAARRELDMAEYDALLAHERQPLFGLRDVAIDVGPFKSIYDSHFAGSGRLVLDAVTGYQRQYRWA